jgi:hypothetical protein
VSHATSETVRGVFAPPCQSCSERTAVAETWPQLYRYYFYEETKAAESQRIERLAVLLDFFFVGMHQYTVGFYYTHTHTQTRLRSQICP